MPGFKAVTFSGLVQRDENFAFPFTERFCFELVPIDYGWHIAIHTGPNEDSVNAPQYERDFIFSPKVGRTIQYAPTPG